MSHPYNRYVIEENEFNVDGKPHWGITCRISPAKYYDRQQATEAMVQFCLKSSGGVSKFRVRKRWYRRRR